jgi:hypothetical protein
VLWSKTGLDVGEEGDVDEGDPHELKVQPAVETKQSEEKRDGIRVQSAAGVYVCYPKEGLVYGEHNGHYYTWDLVKDSFFAVQNPKVTEAMEAADTLKSLGGHRYRVGIPAALRSYTSQYKGESYDENVWPLVKSRMPAPGKILKLENAHGETLFGVTTPTSLEFYDRAASRVSVELFDRTYDRFDLVRDGNVPPASLFSFLTKHFQVNKNFLSEVATAPDPLTKGTVFSVEGEGTPGWEDVSAEGEDFVKSVRLDGDVLKVVRA